MLLLNLSIILNYHILSLLLFLFQFLYNHLSLTLFIFLLCLFLCILWLLLLQMFFILYNCFTLFFFRLLFRLGFRLGFWHRSLFLGLNIEKSLQISFSLLKTYNYTFASNTCLHNWLYVHFGGGCLHNCFIYGDFGQRGSRVLLFLME